MDPRTRQESGQFQSVFQVGSDAGRGIKMLGCILIVAGAFAQFYMRAGIFTDGGKRERARAAARADPGGGDGRRPRARARRTALIASAVADRECKTSVIPLDTFDPWLFEPGDSHATIRMAHLASASPSYWGSTAPRRPPPRRRRSGSGPPTSSSASWR